MIVMYKGKKETTTQSRKHQDTQSVSRVLVLCEMQSVLSRNWTRIAVSISCDDNHYTKVMPSAECHTNHHLVCCTLRLHFKPKLRKEVLPKEKFNLNKLQSVEVKADFQADLQSKFENSDCPEDTSETLWDQLKSAIL